MEQVEPFLPPGRQPLPGLEVDTIHSLILGGRGPRPGVRRFHVVYGDGSMLVKTHDLEEALQVLEASVRLYIGLTARRRLFVHAGAVGIRGGGLVLPGRSEAGKSTLVSALISTGATYFSDEYAVLDSHGRLHPYAQDLSVQTVPDGPFRRLSPDQMGASAAQDSARVRLVLVTQYRAGARFRPRRLSPGGGVMAILPHVLPAQYRPRFMISSLSRLAERVPVFASDRADCDAVIDWLRREGWFELSPVPIALIDHGRPAVTKGVEQAT